MTAMKGFSNSANRYKKIFGRAYKAHLALIKHQQKLFNSGHLVVLSSTAIERAGEECEQWLKTYATLKGRFERHLEERTQKFLTLSGTERQLQAEAFVAAFEEEQENLEQAWQAAHRRIESLLALHELLESQQEMLQLARERHIELVADCSPAQREKEVAFASFFPIVGTTGEGADASSDLLTLREIAPSPINIVLLANGNNSRWQNERVQWVQEILVGWGLSSGTWPLPYRFRIQDWGLELWSLFVTDDFRWPFIGAHQTKSYNANELNSLLKKLERTLYDWQRGRALDASRLYREIANSDGADPTNEKELKKRLAADKRKEAVERKIEAAHAKREDARRNRLIESAIAAKTPETLLLKWEDKEMLAQALSSHRGARRLTEREHLVLRLKSVPGIRTRQIAALVQVSERTISSDLSMICYYLNQPAGTPTRKRRKQDACANNLAIVTRCANCENGRLVKRGHTRNGKQRYSCTECGRTTREDAITRLYSEERKEGILLAHRQGTSLRALSRTYGVSRQTVAKWIKDAAEEKRRS